MKKRVHTDLQKQNMKIINQQKWKDARKVSNAKRISLNNFKRKYVHTDVHKSQYSLPVTNCMF